MNNYITPGTVFPKFYQFPDFLLREKISHTAKLTYMVLYDRSRLSLKNGWVKDGKIYTVFPINELAKVLGRSQSAVKAALNELEGKELLARRSGGFAKANILFVRIPPGGRHSDEVRKSTSVNAEFETDDVLKPVPSAVGFLPANKINYKNNNIHNNSVSRTLTYGPYKNIYLSDEEYLALQRQCGSPKLALCIQDMSGELYRTDPNARGNYSALKHRMDGA